MVGRPASNYWFDPVETQFAKVKLLDESVDDTDWIVIGNIVLKIVGK